MDHFADFAEFAVPDFMQYGTFYRESPTAVAVRILQDYKCKSVVIGCDTFLAGMVEATVIVPDDQNGIEDLFKGIETDYIYLDFRENKIPMYVIQRMVVGSSVISQVERLRENRFKP